MMRVPSTLLVLPSPCKSKSVNEIWKANTTCSCRCFCHHCLVYTIHIYIYTRLSFSSLVSKSLPAQCNSLLMNKNMTIFQGCFNIMPLTLRHDPELMKFFNPPTDHPLLIDSSTVSRSSTARFHTCGCLPSPPTNTRKTGSITDLSHFPT